MVKCRQNTVIELFLLTHVRIDDTITDKLNDLSRTVQAVCQAE